MTVSDTRGPRVAIIVLTWNGRDLTMECLRSLAAVTTPGVQVIVVDNASSDGTADAIQREYGDRVAVVANRENLGFARGNNVAIEAAIKDGAGSILLLNNDTVVSPDFLDPMLAELNAAPDVGIVAPLIYFHTPSDHIWFAGGEVHLWRGTARHTGIRQHDRGQFSAPRDIGYATGCALLARREVIEEIGMLDPSYVAYFEDTDFSMRARRAGWRIRYVPAAKVWHKVSASTGGQLSRRKILLKSKSAWRFFRRYARPWHFISIPFFLAADMIRIALLVALGRIQDTGPSTHRPASGQDKA